MKDPRLLLYGDSAVLILRPAEFYRKKREIEQAGPSHLQVFSSFEHVLTHFKDENGGKLLKFKYDPIDLIFLFFLYSQISWLC